MPRTVYFISDGTGISTEALGKMLITQFSYISFSNITIPFVNTKQVAIDTINKIQQDKDTKLNKPIIFSTIIDPEIKDIFVKSDFFFIDFFKPFINVLEQEFNTKSIPVVGQSHAVIDEPNYTKRIDAINFAINNDDGLNTKDYSKADLILIGASRTGKTPTCIYLAMQFGIKAANYPITDEDFTINQLPKPLQPYKDKLFGLSVYPERLQEIRSKRRANTEYSSIQQCTKEIKFIENLLLSEKIPYINTTNLSIEELSTQIMAIAGLKRLYS
jgi:[pyruvate, water dikinase]-phosphate phosphotransferase / [pyruvate, water dikinase] kinase